MPHIRLAGLDLVTAAFVVHPNKPRVALVHHKKLGSWFAPGGHVGDTDPYENADQAMERELREETGLVVGYDVTVYQHESFYARREAWRMFATNPHNSMQLRVPWAVEQHDFPTQCGQPLHRHMALVYLMLAQTQKLVLEEEAHNHIKWMTEDDLNNPTYGVFATMRWYGRAAIRHYYPDRHPSAHA